MEYCYHSFVLRMKLKNKGSNSVPLLPVSHMIERTVLLKNSNVLSEVLSEEILLYNLHKMSNKYDLIEDDFIL
jgi:hypothetical protein